MTENKMAAPNQQNFYVQMMFSITSRKLTRLKLIFMDSEAILEFFKNIGTILGVSLGCALNIKWRGFLEEGDERYQMAAETDKT